MRINTGRLDKEIALDLDGGQLVQPGLVQRYCFHFCSPRFLLPDAISTRRAVNMADATFIYAPLQEKTTTNFLFLFKAHFQELSFHF